MRIEAADIPGAYLLRQARLEDERGFFARTFCKDIFADHNLNADIVQISTSFNTRAGTLRGLHYQCLPCEEDKVVRCTRGAIFDVIVDMRPASPTLKQWCSYELDAVSGDSIYVPKGFAHGFQTLEDASEVLYMMTEKYSPEHARGIRWDDSALGIDWPITDPIISDRDRKLPNLP